MIDDNLMPLNDNGSSDALLPVSAAKQSNGECDAFPLQAIGPNPAGPNLTVYAHALRRHWLLALGIGLLCAAILGPAVYFLVGDKFTAFSYIRISMQENALLFPENTGSVDRDRFEIYKTTQQSLLRSRFVLTAALDKAEVAKIPTIREELDPVAWLDKQLSVSFPGKGEVMAVSITLDNPKEAQLLVKAVVDAYMTEVVSDESNKKRNRLSELEKIYAAKEQDIRTKREALKRMAQISGGTGADVLNIKQKLLLEQLSSVRRQELQAQFDKDSVRGQLAAQRALLKTVDTANVPTAELEQMLQADPVVKDLSMQLAERRQAQSYIDRTVKKGAKNNGYVKSYDDEVASLQSQYDSRVAAIHAKARQKRRQDIVMEIVKLEALEKATAKQQTAAGTNVGKMTAEASKFGVTSVELDMLQKDLAQLDFVQARFLSEMEKLRVEIKSSPRISVMEPAEKPLAPSNTLVRIAVTILAMMAGLCLPAAAVVLLDIRTRRINTADDVSQGLQLPVIGSMPLIPAKVIRQLGSPSPRYRAWHLRLTESVDGIAARLLHKADLEQCRVIMVSSATGGEGKTTLATQLALSLARTGRQTVLVDFDLRRPSFDEVFGVPLSPGVSETLRHESDADDLVHQTATDNLAVVAAGRWNRQALASLSNGGAAAMFKNLREAFEFVVVDTSPLLPVADARFVSKFVDTVVLSIFRDISEAPKIQAACDILAAFGVRSVEAVVTGSSNDMYGKHTGYESTVSA